MRSPSDSNTALIIAYHFPPSNSVGMQRTVRFVRHLPALGWRPVVLTAREADLVDTPLDPTWQAQLPSALPVYRTRVLRPLRMALHLRNKWRRLRPKASASTSEPSRLKAQSAPTRTWVQRWIDPWFLTPDAEIGWVPSAIWRGLQLVRRESVNILYTSGPPHSTHLIGALLKWLTGRPWVADFRDPWTRRPWLQVADRQGLRYRLLVWLEAKLIRYADQVVLNTEPMAEEFRQFYVAEPRDKFSAIPNGYDPETFPVQPLPERSEQNPAVFTITHAGSLYRRRDPRPLLQAVSQLRQYQMIRPGTFKVQLIGALDPAFQVPKLIETLRLTDLVTLVPPVSYRASLDYLSHSDLLLLIQPDTHLQVPGKLFEYLYLGKPVLALTGAGATAELIDKHQLGVVVQPRQTTAIARTVGRYYQAFCRGERPLVRCEAALSRFHVQTLTRELVQIFETRCSTR